MSRVKEESFGKLAIALYDRNIRLSAAQKDTLRVLGDICDDIKFVTSRDTSVEYAEPLGLELVLYRKPFVTTRLSVWLEIDGGLDTRP